MAQALSTPRHAASPPDDGEHPGADGASDHVLPIKTYLKVYGALLLLTLLTVQVSVLDLGAVAIAIALVVASVKAGLVAGYFMHLKYDARFHTLVFLSSVLFLAIFFALTMIDLGSRESVVEQEGNFVLRDDQAASPPAAVGAGSAPAPSAPRR